MSESRSLATWLREIRAGSPALVGGILICLAIAAFATVRQAQLYGATGAVVVSPERFLQSEGTDALPALTENVVRLSATQAVLLPAAEAYADAATDPAERSERRRTATLKWLRKHIKVEAVGTSSVVEITGTATTREQANDLTRSVVDELTNFVRETRGQEPTPTGEPEPPSGLITLSAAESEGQVSPTPLRNFLVALNAGLLLGLVLAIALGRHRLRSDPRQVAAELGVPLLAVDRGGRAKDHAIAEAQRLIEGLKARRGAGSIVVLVTGTAGGGRIAHVAERLAGSLGLGTGKRALLVDGDLTERALSWQLWLADRPGVSDLLTPGSNSNELEESVVALYEPTDEPGGVAALPAGPPTDEAMNGARFSAMLEPLREEFDYFVVTGPSVAKTKELLTLMSAAHYCLLVTEGSVSPQRLAAARMLRQDARPGAMGLIGMRGSRRWLQLPS